MIEFGNALRSSWQAMSFLLKLVGTLKSDGLEIGWIDKNNALSAGVSGALLIALENEMKDLFVPLVVPITASGLQG